MGCECIAADDCVCECRCKVDGGICSCECSSC